MYLLHGTLNLQIYNMIEGFGSLNLTSQDFVMSQLNTDDLPQSITQIPKIHKLDHLVIKNFKSFSKMFCYNL